MEGAIGLLTLAIVVWGFWIGYEWFLNPNRKWNKEEDDEVE